MVWKLVAAGVLLALVAWTAICLSGISEELGAEYDGFFTDFSVAFLVLLIAVPWLVTVVAYLAVRRHARPH